MKTTLLATTSDFLSAWTELVEWADEIRFSHAWIDSLSPGWKALEPHLEKVRASVVGVHFGRTDPKAIRALVERATGQIRVIEQEKGTFHPKVLVGFKGQQRRIILGSGNMTRGAFGKNTEINVLMAGKVPDRIFGDLERALDAHWNDGRRPSPNVLDEIRSAWMNRQPTTKAVLSKATRRDKGILSMTWTEYYDKFDIKNIAIALQELAEAQEWFATMPRFTDIAPEGREFIVGLGASEHSFGHNSRNMPRIMKQKTLVTKIGELIDPIPLDPYHPIDTSIIHQAFKIKDQIRGVGMASITRLLCVKRPDYFFPVNGGNETRMTELIGRPPKTGDEYIAMLETIHAAPWFEPKRRPRDPREREVWNARVALLDRLLYEPPP